jgi:Tfp pilus assembly protein PilF
MDRLDTLLSFLEMDPDDLFTRFAIAMEHAKHGNDAEAERWFLDILKRDERYIGVYYHLGGVYERRDSVFEAKNIYTRGIGLARSMGEHHAASELEAALLELS